MITKVLILIILLGVTSINAKTPGQVLDEKFEDIQTNISIIANASIIDLRMKYEQLEQDMKVFKIIHGPCAPCLSIHGTSNYCDCRNLEPMNDCLDFHQAGVRVNGIYKISAEKFTSRYAFCDQKTQGGGWTVFQRRKDGSVNFYRGWADYKSGFGKLENEFWFGNDNLHDLTKSSNAPKSSTLLINMVINGQTKPVYVKYNNFQIGDEGTKYKLQVSGYFGNITDKLSYHNNMKFSTYDQDNDNKYFGNCASLYKGGWWYRNCYYSNLNGVYSFTKSNKEIYWNGYAKFVEMKVRRNT